MTRLRTEIERIFAEARPLCASNAALPIVWHRLARCDATHVLLLDGGGRVLAAYPDDDDPLAAAMLERSAAIVEALAADAAARLEFPDVAPGAAVVGVRLPHPGPHGAALAVLTRGATTAADAQAAGAAVLGQLAALSQRHEEELREARTRVRHLRTEHETLRRDHESIVNAVLEEREIHLQQKRRHILELEDEVKRRSAALHEALSRAEQASRAKSEFLANVSHELRTPLTAILGFAENLLDPELSESDRAQAVEIIQRNGEHLLELINDILDLSKIEAGKLSIERVACSPAALAADVLALLRGRAANKGLELSANVDGAIPETIETDPTRLRQVLLNLLGNAIKFTERGSVHLTVAFDPRSAADAGPGTDSLMRFEIRDTGIGMSDEQLARLFQPFTQADASTSRRFGGTGLGLHISRRLALKLGGDLVASSRRGEGSTFVLTVAAGNFGPLTAAHEVTLEADPVRRSAAACVAAEPTPLRARVLLVEDGPDNQRLIAYVLKRCGCEVHLAEDGIGAVEKALSAWRAGRPYDVILMDMQLPRLDGYDATSRLREAGYRGPILALTAHAMKGDRERCLRAGCDDFAAKPIDRARLIEQIRALLSPAPAAAAPSRSP